MMSLALWLFYHEKVLPIAAPDQVLSASALLSCLDFQLQHYSAQIKIVIKYKTDYKICSNSMGAGGIYGNNNLKGCLKKIENPCWCMTKWA